MEDPEQGHGRVIGEVCHFVDLFAFLSEALPIEVEAWAMGDSNDESNVHIQVSLADGSKGEILYLAWVTRAFPKKGWRSSAEAAPRFVKTSESPTSIIPTTAMRNPCSSRTKGTQKKYSASLTP